MKSSRSFHVIKRVDHLSTNLRWVLGYRIIKKIMVILDLNDAIISRFQDLPKNPTWEVPVFGFDRDLLVT